MTPLVLRTLETQQALERRRDRQSMSLADDPVAASQLATTVAVSNKVWISAGRRGSTQHDSFRRVRSEGREQDPRQSNGRPDHLCRLMAVR